MTAQIVAKTDGVPLFVEELTKTVLESGLLIEGPQGWRLDGPLPLRMAGVRCLQAETGRSLFGVCMSSPTRS